MSTLTASLNDAMFSYFASKGFSTGSIDDRFFAYLGSLGYTGALDDRINSWLGGSGALNDRWMSFLSVYSGDINDRQYKFFSEAYKLSVLADSPVSYWRLSESSGTTAVDDMGVHNGTYVASPTLGATGRFPNNTAVTFNGSTQYVETGDLSLFEGTNCSYEFWAKTTNANALTTFSEGNTGNGTPFTRFRLCNGGGTARFDYRNDAGGTGTLDGTLITSDGLYHHLVVTKASTSIILYIDGLAQGSPLTFSGALTLNRSVAGCFGRTGQGEFFDGTIDELAVYNTALSPARVAAHFAAAA